MMKCAEKLRYTKSFATKILLHKVRSKNSTLKIHRFFWFHLVEGIPFNLPHTIYMNISSNLKGNEETEDVTYATSLNKLF